MLFSALLIPAGEPAQAINKGILSGHQPHHSAVVMRNDAGIPYPANGYSVRELKLAVAQVSSARTDYISKVAGNSELLSVIRIISYSLSAQQIYIIMLLLTK